LVQHYCKAEMITEQDWIGTDACFGWIRSGSDCKCSENWWIRTGLDWEIFVVLMWLF